MTGRNSKVDKIFSLLDQGLDYSAIIERRDRARERDQNSRARGMQSEQNTKQALRSLYYVRAVKHNQRGSDHDYFSHDLTVNLDSLACIQILPNGLVIPNAQVFVQVVSSQNGIDFFKKETKARLDGDEDAYQAYLVREKLVVLNGQLPDYQIQAFFYDQLVALNMAWAMR